MVWWLSLLLYFLLLFFHPLSYSCAVCLLIVLVVFLPFCPFLCLAFSWSVSVVIFWFPFMFHVLSYFINCSSQVSISTSLEHHSNCLLFSLIFIFHVLEHAVIYLAFYQRNYSIIFHIAFGNKCLHFKEITFFSFLLVSVFAFASLLLVCPSFV